MRSYTEAEVLFTYGRTEIILLFKEVFIWSIITDSFTIDVREKLLIFDSK